MSAEIRLILETGRSRPSGLIDLGERVHPFDGWMQLMALIDGATRATDDDNDIDNDTETRS